MPSQAPLPKRFFLMIDEVRYGPFTLAHLQALWRRKEINAETMFWQEEDPDWQPVSVLQSKLEARSYAELEEAREHRRRTRSIDKRSDTFRTGTIVTIVLLLIVVMVVAIVLLASGYW